MKQPFWKRWWSYVNDIEIESTSSEINEDLIVLLSKGEYQLCTPDAIYSYGKHYDNFYEAFQKINLPPTNSTSLILGLGLASIPLILERYFNHTSDYTAIEIDDEVIRLASKYVINDLSSPLSIINTDALYYVAITEDTYDTIFVDIFLSAEIPPQFETKAFLLDIKERLNPGGVILLNRLFYFENDKRATELFFNQVFLNVFPDGDYLPVVGNWILVSDKNFVKGEN